MFFIFKLPFYIVIEFSPGTSRFLETLSGEQWPTETYILTQKTIMKEWILVTIFSLNVLRDLDMNLTVQYSDMSHVSEREFTAQCITSKLRKIFILLFIISNIHGNLAVYILYHVNSVGRCFFVSWHKYIITTEQTSSHSIIQWHCYFTDSTFPQKYRSEHALRVGFEVLTAVVIKSSIIFDIMPCSPAKVTDV
jgi:hypothetical protein